MSTTNLCVELVVIGVGAATWLLLSILAIFGWKWLPASEVLGAASLIPTLSLIYLLGILTDRLADLIFERLWVKELRKHHFVDAAAYHRARMLILTESERLAELLEYGRSRLRICRGWAMNAVLIAVALNWFVWAKLDGVAGQGMMSAVGSVVFVGIAGLAYFSWQSLADTEYRK